MKITKEWLEEHDACEYQIVEFMAEWPDGVTITKEGLVRTAELELDIHWLALEVLEPPAYFKYSRMDDRAYIKYDHVTNQAWNEYTHVRACITSERMLARALAKYERAKAQAWTKYCSIRAQAFMFVMGM